MNAIVLENAIRCLEDARRELLSLYMTDPADEMAAAQTPVPLHLADLSISLHAAHEHLLNLRDLASAK
jgi:hypothetical protein